MEFESPDVEKDFPGLYASETGKRSNESDFSDDAHDRLSKKDLLIGKRKDKKDSKKDRGYAALEGESSPEEDPEIKSPSKSKKSKSFKFPSTSKKEKREKSREKDSKEKERETDKEKKREKDGKVKLRLKERKKSKHGDDSVDIDDEHVVFGIPLQLAVKRSRCHDGVDIPLVIRNTIDYIEEHGLKIESIYKLSGIKSKVQQLRRLYNQREPVNLEDYEIPVITSLLKQFFRELPEPLLTTELLPRFEDAAAVKVVLERENELGKTVQQLPEYNRQLLSWLLIHLDNVAQNEKCNKMNAQNIAITLGPVLQMSLRLLTALLCHCKSLFPNFMLTKYVPPLSSGSPSLPDTGQGITDELRKQESLLSQIHQEMNAGFVSKQKEEQLWEVQRIITQLKRKLRLVQRSRDTHQNQKSLDEDRTDHKSCDEEFRIDLTLQKAHSCSEEDATSSIVTQTLPINQITIGASPSEPKHPVLPSLSASVEESFDHAENQTVPSHDELAVEVTGESLEPPSPDDERQALLQEEAVLQLEQKELLHLQADLQGRVLVEKAEVEKLRAQVAITRNKYNYSAFGCDSSDGSSSPLHSDQSDLDDPQVESQIAKLKNENFILQQKKCNLIRCIMEEREACLHLRVQLSLMQLTHESKQL